MTSLGIEAGDSKPAAACSRFGVELGQPAALMGSGASIAAT
jgi:hypothetical protein